MVSDPCRSCQPLIHPPGRKARCEPGCCLRRHPRRPGTGRAPVLAAARTDQIAVLGEADQGWPELSHTEQRPALRASTGVVGLEACLRRSPAAAPGSKAAVAGHVLRIRSSRPAECCPAGAVGGCGCRKHARLESPARPGSCPAFHPSQIRCRCQVHARLVVRSW